MRNTLLDPCEKLKTQLFKIGDIVDKFESKNNSAIKQWYDWLKQTEAILKQYNFSETAELAGLRAESLLQPSSLKAKPPTRKITMQQVLGTVSPAQTMVLHLQKNLEEKLENARHLIRQIVLAAKQANLLKNSQQDKNFTTYLESFLAQIQQHDQLQSGIQNIISAIGRADTLRILAEEISFD